MKIYLMRHGETDYNKERLIQGSLDIPLNDYGRELAMVTSDALKDVSFDAVFTSPLQRAKETARIIVRDRDVTWKEDIRIQEICFGEYEGMCCGFKHYNIPDENREFLNFFHDTANYKVPKNGESFQDVISRTGAFLEEVLSDQKLADKTILISTHGCALKAMLAYLRKTPIAEFWGEGVHKNCAVTIMEAHGRKVEILEEGKLFYEYVKR